MEHSRPVQFDRQLLEVYLVGLQSEVEATLLTRPPARGRWKLTEQIDRILGTNRVVRETLLELLDAVKALARDLRDEH